MIAIRSKVHPPRSPYPIARILGYRPRQILLETRFPPSGQRRTKRNIVRSSAESGLEPSVEKERPIFANYFAKVGQRKSPMTKLKSLARFLIRHWSSPLGRRTPRSFVHLARVLGQVSGGLWATYIPRWRTLRRQLCDHVRLPPDASRALTCSLARSMVIISRLPVRFAQAFAAPPVILACVDFPTRPFCHEDGKSPKRPFHCGRNGRGSTLLFFDPALSSFVSWRRRFMARPLGRVCRPSENRLSWRGHRCHTSPHLQRP